MFSGMRAVFSMSGCKTLGTDCNEHYCWILTSSSGKNSESEFSSESLAFQEQTSRQEMDPLFFLSVFISILFVLIFLSLCLIPVPLSSLVLQVVYSMEMDQCKLWIMGCRCCRCLGFTYFLSKWTQLLCLNLLQDFSVRHWGHY